MLKLQIETWVILFSNQEITEKVNKYLVADFIEGTGNLLEIIEN